MELVVLAFVWSLWRGSVISFYMCLLKVGVGNGFVNTSAVLSTPAM